LFNFDSVTLSATFLGMNLSGFPNYSYADELKSPRELNIKRDGSFDGIMRAVAGINYYADSVGFGESTMFAKAAGMQQSPLGVRVFVETGAKCSNGAPMWEYVDTIPKGIGGRVGEEMKAMQLPNLRGLGPGIVEDAVTALNPIPLIDTAIRGGYAKCKQVTKPVGDAEGRTASRYDPKNVWVQGPTQMIDGKPHQTKWVFDSWTTPDKYDATPKTESFQNQTLFSLKTSQAAAVVLLGAMVAGIYLTRK
jgi:hypothetical protein